MLGNQIVENESSHKEVTRELKAIMFDYIIKVNSRYRANEFTSSQLTKMVMTSCKIEKTRFSLIHRLVKETLKEWQEQGLCTHVSCTKYSRCRKTKDTYRIKPQGIEEFKKRAIEETIRTINEGKPNEQAIMKTRGMIIKDKLDEIASNFNATTKNQENDLEIARKV
jgi:DNA-binding PadR family transcriptional regulator